MADRILLLLGPSSGGIRRHVAILRDGLRALGHEVSTAGPAGVLDGLGGLDHEVPVADDPRRLPGAARALRRAAAEADLVHAHGLRAATVAIAARARPRVLTVHNVVLDDATGPAARVLRAVEARLPRHVDHTICVSGEIATRLGIAGRADTSVIVPAGPTPVVRRDRVAVRADLGVDDAPLVVAVARLHPQKDLPTLLAAVSRVRDRMPAVRLVIAGSGPEEATLRAEITRLGLAPTVELLGARDDVPDLLAAADVVALSSIWEGSPLVVAEAMTLGRPVVATAVGAVPEAVVDGETGRLVPPRDPQSLADALVEALEDPVRAAAWGAAARAVAETRFAADVGVARVAEVYARVRRGRGNR